MAADVLRELVLPKLEGVRKGAGGFTARCPAHEDSTASLSITEGRSQPVVFHCHAGCAPEDVCKALALDFADLSAPRTADDETWRKTSPDIVYDYTDEHGQLIYQVIRRIRDGKKNFLQRRPDPTGKDGWSWRLGDTRRVPYRLPKVLAAVEECREIYIVEGEKDVHTLESHGLVATCNSGGAGKWLPEHSACLRDAVVTIIADKDNPGRAHARAIRESLTGIAAAITIAEAAGPQTVKDVTDHFANGHTLDDLLITWQSEAEPKPIAAMELWAFLDASDSPPDWVIPGLLEHGDRLLLTGFEGLGKSMLVRQLAICAAAGLHPFDTDYRNNFKPQRVLFIDCENSEQQGRRKMRPIALASKNYSRPVGENMMYVLHRPNGLDVSQPGDAEFIIEQVTAHQPDLLVIGPFYKLHNKNINEELNARTVAAVLDRVRSISNAALLTEAHAGHGEAGKTRSVRPTGSSLLLRWPEFGYGIAPNALSVPDDKGRCTQVDVIAWRGPRDDRDWPRHMEYGRPGHLPWQPWHPPKLPPKETRK